MFSTCLLVSCALLGDGDSTPAAGSGDASEPATIVLSLAENVTVKLFGRVFVDWGWFTGDSPTYNTDGSSLADGTEFRAARLGAEGELYEAVRYRAEFDFSDDGETQLRNVYLALKDTALGEIRGGHFKEPLGLEQNTSSCFITFMERSLADAFVPAFNSGFALFDASEAQTVAWSAGIFRSTDAFGFATGDAQYSYTARLSGTPWNEDESADLLHLGGGISYRKGDARFRTRPEAHLLNQPADSGTIAADDSILAGLEAAWVRGPFSAQAEYLVASVDAASGGTDADYSGYYAFVSWFLTGEHRPYKGAYGVFDRVKPNENFGKGKGAIELAARYSSIDLDDGPSSDTMDDVTLGLNWYLNPNTRVMVNAVHSEFDDGTLDDSADLLMLRLQVDW